MGMKGAGGEGRGGEGCWGPWRGVGGMVMMGAGDHKAGSIACDFETVEEEFTVVYSTLTRIHNHGPVGRWTAGQKEPEESL
ncbi:hypothetical protein Pcinc_030205 [Petrolisthes cinctipes]|uniref:Uncharacterized protein n=1 Tax=Petrolisthes cinctipes TaxID=88211 RepID=A0AAE1EZB8_PETCI|nr:hypothetical protein Pcinc_030205 [Petrolisthes cinctipes]